MTPAPHSRVEVVAALYTALGVIALLHSPRPGLGLLAFGTAHLVAAALLFHQARWAALPISLLAGMYALEGLLGTALCGVTLLWVWLPPRLRPPSLVFVALVLAAATVHLHLHGWSDVARDGDELARLLTAPGMRFGEDKLGLQRTGPWYAARFPAALLASQLAFNLGLAALLRLAGRWLVRAWECVWA